VLAVIVGLVAWWAVKERRVRFAAGYVVLCVLPVCNFVPIYHPIADRYLYNPLIGLVTLAAIGLDHPWLSATFPRKLTVTLAVLVLVACLLPITMQRQLTWSSELQLWEDTKARNPVSFSAQTNLPEVLLIAGQPEAARKQTEETLRTSLSTYAWIWFDYAIELERLGDHAGAQRAAKRAIALQPDIGNAPKMVATLQAPSSFAKEFARIAGTLPPPSPKQSPSQ
jgi:tetratricopeptide (TPR) repeat protein